MEEASEPLARFMTAMRIPKANGQQISRQAKTRIYYSKTSHNSLDNLQSYN